MLKKSIISLAFAGVLSLAFLSFSNPDNTCPVYGKVTDIKTGEAIPFANISLYNKDSVLVVASSTDANGEYCLKTIPDGSYKLIVSTIGYERKVLNGITVNATTNKKLDISIAASQIQLKETEVVSQDIQMAPVNSLACCVVAKSSTRGFRKNKNFEKQEDFNTEEYSKINDNEFKESKKNPFLPLV